MSVLVEEQFGGHLARPVRRTRQSATSRPPSGQLAVDPRTRVRPASCHVRRPARKAPFVSALAAGVCATVAVFGMVIGGLAEGISPSVPERTTLVTVGAGETLWQVASRYAPDSDPRAVVARIEELNGVNAGHVAAGQPLAVPVQSGVVLPVDDGVGF